MENNVLKEKIIQLKKEKNAVILGHYYQREEIQDVSDFIGDSLALAQEAQRSERDIIIFCGVHFMAETAKILNPSRKVLLPDMKASCSLAESCQAADFRRFKEAHPDHMVISYINCTAEIKSLSDLICTSGNAEKLVNALPRDQKIIFAPDKNLGGYINQITGREMLLWDGVCRVHDALKAETVVKMKQRYPGVPVIAHPECNSALLAEADFVGSTKAMLNYIAKEGKKQYIVATESGILYEMRKQNPDKQFIVVGECDRQNSIACRDMKLNTLEGLYACLKNETPEIVLSEEMIERSRRPIERMLEMSRRLGLIR